MDKNIKKILPLLVILTLGTVSCTFLAIEDNTYHSDIPLDKEKKLDFETMEEGISLWKSEKKPL